MMGVRCVSRTHVGLRRKVNEDSLLVATEHGLWSVADGMGGHEAGEVASALVVDKLGKVARAATVGDFVRSAIASLEEANDELIALARSDLRPKTIGSTVVALAIGEGEFRCFWAGDSRAYRVRGDDILQLTRDHSLVQDLVEAGMIRPEDAANHPNASVITRAVGAAEELKVETVRGLAKSGDRFLLASDGLTRLVADDELFDELSGKSPDDAADRLIAMTLERGAPDNVTLVIVTVD